MNKISTIFAAIAICGATVLCQSCTNNSQTASSSDAADSLSTKPVAGDIVYIDMDRILSEYDMASDLGAVMQSKTEKTERDLAGRGSSLEKKGNSFQEKINKGLITQSVAEVQYKKLQEEQLALQKYAAQKQQELQEEAVVTQNRILDAISTYVKKYNEDKQFSMILTTSGTNLSAPVVCADSSKNITNEIIAGLNAEYVKAKAEGKTEED